CSRRGGEGPWRRKCIYAAPGGLDGAGLPGALLEIAQRGGKQGLVDAAVENRYAHLHALEDDLAPFHLHLVRELGGRQVNGQTGLLSRCWCRPCIPPQADVSIKK